MKYDFKKIEKKWQKFWEEKRTYFADDKSRRKKKYILIEFPYPSGEGLHMGHLRPYTAGDVYSRFLKMNGSEVMYPIGWDAFGLPAENYAIKHGVHPSISTAKNIANAKKQLRSWGIGFDWSREINTTDPNYYKWTQWIFLQLFKAGLAYEAKGMINWCPKDKTGLANEEVINGCCERCGAKVEKKEMRQWYLKITAYAEKLLNGLKKLDWPEKIKIQQENWIGKSEGVEIDFEVKTKEKPNFLILHGRNGSPKSHLFPWLKSELEKKGYKVQAPFLPNTDEPDDEEQTQFVLKKCKLDKNTVIVGHSFGGIVALRLLEKGIKAQKVVLLCTPFFGKFLDNKVRASVTRACRKGFNFKKILAGKTSFDLLYDTTDYVVPLSDGETFSKKLKVPLNTVAGKEPHLSGKREPAVLEKLSPLIKVFTTRPDTLFGATYMVLAPEHQLISNLKSRIINSKEVELYLKKAVKKSDEERIAEGKEKTGVELKGIKAINPANGKEIPVWIADYVLTGYGTGAIMAVPAHDERDFEFAKKYKLPVQQVIAPHLIDKEHMPQKGKENTKRNVVHVLLKHPTEDKVIALRHRKFPWLTPITGGIEKGESAIAAAAREIKEETGYKNFRFVKRLPFKVFAEFYAAHKSVNRLTLCDFLFFELVDEKRGAVSSEERANYDVEWLPLKDIHKFTPVSELDFMIEFLKRGEYVYTGDGLLINSDKFDGMPSEKAKWEITKFVGGKRKTQYRLRDWVFSRQRYWGEPIPLVFCETCKKRAQNRADYTQNSAEKFPRKSASSQRESAFSKGEIENPGWIAVSEENLPVKLPPVKKYKPTGTGESPLAAIKSWVSVKCPKCGGAAKRETNTMPQWAGSSWYYLRYCDPNNKKEFSGQKLMKRWLPVDVYFGGLEHTTLHLLYSRFWHLFLHDKKLVPSPEPYTRRIPHGIILGPDNEKMSKSRGNVVSPDSVIKKFGADCLRMYELFLGPHEATVSWNSQGILGISRFLERVYKKFCEPAAEKSSGKTEQVIHRAVKKVGEDIRSVKFNTAVSALMICMNEIEGEKLSRELREMFLKILAPFAPYLAEELWQRTKINADTSVQIRADRNQRKSAFRSIHLENWPSYDEKLIKSETFTLVIQVNGKVRDTVEAPAGISKTEAEKLALGSEKIKNIVKPGAVKKVIYVPNRLVNIVI